MTDARDDSAGWWAADENPDIFWVHSPTYPDYALAMGLNEFENIGPNPWPKEVQAFSEACGYAKLAFWEGMA